MGRKKYPILSASEELALAKAWRDHGDLEARNSLIEFHFPLAGKIAAKYDGGGIPLGWQVKRKPYHPKTAYLGRNDGGQPANDIGQVALLGLIEAPNRFDPALGRFSTYARFWVTKYIKGHRTHLKKSGADVNGGRALALNARIENGEDGSSTDFANMMIEGEGIGGEFYSVIAGPIPRPQEDSLIEVEHDEIHHHALAVALAALDDRDRRIYEARFLNEPKVKLKDLAAEFKVSQKRISVLAERAHEKVHASYERTVALLPQVKMAT
jgi:RNA polymerase sigma-32 factor